MATGVVPALAQLVRDQVPVPGAAATSGMSPNVATGRLATAGLGDGP
jgi:hypothetical protein